MIDVAAHRLGYFHNAGNFALDGADFDALFAPPPLGLPLFAELVRIDRAQRLPEPELRRIAAVLLQRHLAWRPASNPVTRFRAGFEADLPALQRAGLPTYHRWAFASVRQLDAAFELAAQHLQWLHGGAPPHPAAADFERIAQDCKTLILKAARAVNSGRGPDTAALFDEMAAAWERGMAALP